mgnify:CR=1 FL=1
MYQPIYLPHGIHYRWFVRTCNDRVMFHTADEAWAWVYQHGLAH